MAEDSGKITIGVGLCPIVSSSTKEAFVGEEIILTLISGLSANELFWRCDGKVDIPTPDSLIIIFNETGLYVPVAQGHLLHVSYGINVVEEGLSA